METLRLTDDVEQQLRESLLDGQDLIDAVRQGKRVPVVGEPEHFQCVCIVPVRRPLDPETAELRRLEVTCRRTPAAVEIYRVKGLRTIEDF